ncbi:uncharacterized protein HMPREF1541_11134 [Cyphellophora europaea CBS 101466]|uniref:Transcription factor domain-containing protein n=1 Tax=Cyphellophora europaea (strain CBS 101466) TaxID=1220924 RepID=W2S5B6_CYPE1|nr:uncharacterized protein HMPREF1541_11134 [Cyphellophora europaea CBS 101466]ETN43810.1 hypothetical protein HMPREF1541_11134 [Cyphellophora europaea CBS 101466]
MLDIHGPDIARIPADSKSLADDGKPELEPSMESTFSIHVPVNTSLNEQVLSFVTSPDPATSESQSTEDAEFDTDDWQTLERFKNRTVFSIGSTSSQFLYQREIPRLAKEHSVLMHLTLTLTLMQDRFFEDVRLEEPSKQTEAEAYHWYQGTVIFNTQLRQLHSPMNSDERDALWGSAVMLGCIAFFCIEGETPQEVWPLKPPGPLDLDWLKISDGKKEVWRVANPLRPDSCFSSLADEQVAMVASALGEAPIMEGFKELWDMHPYKRAAGVIGELMSLEVTRRTFLHFLTFIAYVEGDFGRALGQRDPKALLLLGMWYAKVARYKQWWPLRRAVLEGQAIALYLEQNHPEFVQGPARHMHDFVRRGTGLEKDWGWRDFAREAGMGNIGDVVGTCRERFGSGYYAPA